MSDLSRYPYTSAEHNDSHRYLLPAVLAQLSKCEGRRILEVGSGNGSVANALVAQGYEVIGVEPSESGLREARQAYPLIRFEPASGYDDLQAMFGQFSIVLSIEVVEHLFDPRTFVRRCHDALLPEGKLLLTTPFHGYWKNVALALSGKMDNHFTALWDGGHIKFWSQKTMTRLLQEGGFKDIRFQGVGRIRPLSKSMLVTATR